MLLGTCGSPTNIQQYLSAKFAGQADFSVLGAPAMQAIFNPLV